MLWGVGANKGCPLGHLPPYLQPVKNKIITLRRREQASPGLFSLEQSVSFPPPFFRRNQRRMVFAHRGEKHHSLASAASGHPPPTFIPVGPILDQLVLLRSQQGQGGPPLLRCLFGHPFPITGVHAFDDSPEAYALRAIIQRLQDDLAVGFRFPPPSVDQGPDPEIRTLVTTPLRLHRSAKGVKFGREFGPKEHVTVPFRNGDCSCRFPLGNFGQLAFTPSIPPILSHCPDDISPLPPCLSTGKITPIPLLLLPLTRVAGLIPFVCPRFSTPPLIFLPAQYFPSSACPGAQP